MVGLKPRCGHIVTLDNCPGLNVREAFAIQMALQCRDDLFWIGADDETKLRPAGCLARNGIYRPLRLTRDTGEDLETVPSDDPFNRGQGFLAPVRVDFRRARSRFPLTLSQNLADSRCQRCRTPFRYSNLATFVGNGCQCVRENNCRVGQQAAPVPRMVCALTKLACYVEDITAA